MFVAPRRRSQSHRGGARVDHYLVVDVAVGEHGVEVLDALAGAAVEVVLQALLDRPHVHRLLDDLMVVLGGWARREAEVQQERGTGEGHKETT